MTDTEIIALYLPQFHPTPHNDLWWGKGFTEWTNVGKARPLFRGHEQPKVPADLGYYDLRLPEVYADQSALARQAGIKAFCFYHYWFGNGHQELQLPINKIINQSGGINNPLPLCLCWANESWHKKFWTDFDTAEKQMLAEQTYPGHDDIVNHFHCILPILKSGLYYSYQGRNMFMIYKPLHHPQMREFIDTWRQLAREHDLPDFYFVGHMQDTLTPECVNRILGLGFDAVNSVGLYAAVERSVFAMNPLNRCIFRATRFINHRLRHQPQVIHYTDASRHFLSEIDNMEQCCPTIIPNWDHTPRSGRNGLVFHHSTPQSFALHVRDVLRCVERKSNRLIFLKSWNEWGEGNYMEPDLQWGTAYIDALKAELNR